MKLLYCILYFLTQVQMVLHPDLGYTDSKCRGAPPAEECAVSGRYRQGDVRASLGAELTADFAELKHMTPCEIRPRRGVGNTLILRAVL